MEQTPIKKGHLYRPQKGIKKYWVKRWGLLYPGYERKSPRLETFDNKDAVNKEGSKPTVLSLCGSFKASPTTQHRSRDFVLEIKVDEKVVAFAVDTKDELESWLQVLEEVSEGQEVRRESFAPDLASFSGDVAEGLQENVLYDGYETMTFTISIKPTPFSKSLNLHGSYSLQIDSLKLTLISDNTNNILYAWPYRYLRRYGRDKSSFSMEAGRKCDSGPGLLVFETKEGNDIFHNIQNFVNSISGRHVIPSSQPWQQEQPQTQTVKDVLAWKAAIQSKTPQMMSSAPRSHPVDAIGAITDNLIFKQKLAERWDATESNDDASGQEFKARNLVFQTREQKPTSTSPNLQPDPLYSEVQEDRSSLSNMPTPPIEEGDYSLLQESERPPKMPPQLPELSPTFMYNTTVEEPRADSWKVFGRTEDNIHTENYLSGNVILEKDTSTDPEPVSLTVKPIPLKPKPQLRQKRKPAMLRNKSPDQKKETVSNNANETLYDTCGSVPVITSASSVPEGEDVYDHFVRPTITQPVPAPRKINASQQLQQVDNESELYDHLQRETNIGGPRVPPQYPKPYLPQQRSYDNDDTYDLLAPDSSTHNVVSGSWNNPALPEESQYSEAVLNVYPTSQQQSVSDLSEPQLDENPYDIVSYQ